MNLNNLLVTLPNKKEMLERLLNIKSRITSHEKFYTVLTEYEGLKCSGAYGVTNLIFTALRVHSSRMTDEYAEYDEAAADIDIGILYHEVPLFVDALVVDSDTARMIKKAYAQLNGASA